MNIVLQSLIIVFIFIFILWFQYIDDKNKKKTRTSFYDKFKLPILISCIGGLLIYYANFFINNDNCNFYPFLFIHNKNNKDQLVYTELANW